MGFFNRGLSVFLFTGVCLGAVAQSPETVTIPGRLVDEAGSPVTDAQVHVMQKAGNSQSHSTAYSNEQGAFNVQLAKGGVGVVFSNGKDGDRVLDYKFIKMPPPVDLKLELKDKGRTLRGTVVDEAGNPVPHALVGLAANSREGAGEEMPHFRLGMSGAGMLKLKADEKGVFETDKAPALPVIVWTAAPDDSKGLQNAFRMSPKAASVDLSEGDVLDFKATIDPPASAARTLPSGRAVEVERTEGGKVLMKQAE